MTPDSLNFRESYLQLLDTVQRLQRAVVGGEADGDDPDIYFSTVERYCEGVDGLIDLITDPLFTSIVQEEEHLKLSEILVNHESITAKLETELALVGQQRADLQKKTRGISSYIDKLPKRISTLRTKKG